MPAPSQSPAPSSSGSSAPTNRSPAGSTAARPGPVTAPPQTSQGTVPEGTEAPRNLTERAPRTLGLLDQLGFWGNLGVSLLGFAGALSILTPPSADPTTIAVTAAGRLN